MELSIGKRKIDSLISDSCHFRYEGPSARGLRERRPGNKSERGRCAARPRPGRAAEAEPSHPISSLEGQASHRRAAAPARSDSGAYKRGARRRSGHCFALVSQRFAAMLETLVPLRLVSAAADVTSSPAFTALAVTAGLLMLVLRLYRQAYQKPDNFPPGPPRLPIWGSYWLMLWEDYRYMHKSLLTLAERYKTKVLGFYLGDFPCVMLRDYEDIKEMQSRSDLIGRADVIVARERSLGQRYGVIFSDGPQWTELRRFLLRHIRDFGWGRRFPATEEIMQQELADATALLRGEWEDEEVKCGDEVLISHLFPPYAMNAMWAMFGHGRLARGQHGPWHSIHRSISKFFRVTDPSGSAVSLTPWLRFLTPRRFGLQDITDFNTPVREFVKSAILEHRESLDAGSEARDFLDKFLQRQKELEAQGSPVFTDEQLLLTGVDMITASAGALSGAIAFLWQQLLHHPEAQARVQREVDAVIGRNRVPTLDDRANMPYSEATIRESLRRVTLAPLSIAHVALEDTTIGGYSIPKGTLLYPHLNAIHMSPEIWGDPENFRPERFLEADGSLKKKDPTFPFGGGKRLCLGETYSRHFMFLVLTHVLQNFTLLPTGPLPPIDHAFHGFTLVPDDLWARVVPRP